MNILDNTKNLILTNQDEQQKRLQLCLSCEFKQAPQVLSNTTGVCGKCGCWIDNKIKFKHQSCPILKW